MAKLKYSIREQKEDIAKAILAKHPELKELTLEELLDRLKVLTEKITELEGK
jgi:hypothetical protein